jgi:hypothetical protein
MTDSSTMTIHIHQTAPTQFVAAAGHVPMFLDP